MNLPELRNCSRCGQEYSTRRNSFVCESCRRPRKRLTGELTPREQQVADLVRAGLSNQEIADQLHLSKGTLKVYVSHILAKVGVNSRFALAAKLGMTVLPEPPTAGPLLASAVHQVVPRHTSYAYI